MKTRPSISIVIVTYNAAKFLPATLDSIREQKEIELETIVVDNNSTDNTQEILKKKYPWVIVVKRDTNTGFSAGNNLGVAHAHSNLILFCNPDITFPDKSDIARLGDKYGKMSRVGLLTPRVILHSSGKIDETCHRGFPTPWAAFTHFSGLEKIFPTSRFFSQYTLGYLGYDTEHEIDAIGGMCCLMSRKVGDEVGWWDEKYPFYGEDLDLSYRVKEKGYKNIYWPGVIVVHHKGATTGMSKSSRHVSSASRDTTRQVKKWSVEAMEIFYHKHYRNAYPRPVTWLVLSGIRLMRFMRVGLG